MSPDVAEAVQQAMARVLRGNQGRPANGVPRPGSDGQAASGDRRQPPTLQTPAVALEGDAPRRWVSIQRERSHFADAWVTPMDWFPMYAQTPWEDLESGTLIYTNDEAGALSPPVFLRREGQNNAVVVFLRPDGPVRCVKRTLGDVGGPLVPRADHRLRFEGLAAPPAAARHHQLPFGVILIDTDSPHLVLTNPQGNEDQRLVLSLSQPNRVYDIDQVQPAAIVNSWSLELRDKAAGIWRPLITRV